MKIAPFIRAIEKHNTKSSLKVKHLLVHTGQHYDHQMSQTFFDALNIPSADIHLGVGSGTHAEQVGNTMIAFEKVIMEEKPDWVLVFGDTNSTIAGALAAAKLHIKTAHVEAGLRSFNMRMPEEINRILTDKISNILFCPTETAVNNLKKEGIHDNEITSVLNCGDVMYDAALFYKNLARKPEFEVPHKFVLATIHRAENTDDLERLNSIISALNEISESTEIILPMHPRTRDILKKCKIKPHFRIIEPVGYLQMVYLLKRCNLVMTDSGGLQKEAFFFGKPCITLRNETEWVELVENNYNVLAGADKEKILDCFDLMGSKSLDFSKELYGDGKASNKILQKLKELQ